MIEKNIYTLSFFLNRSSNEFLAIDSISYANNSLDLCLPVFCEDSRAKMDEKQTGLWIAKNDDSLQFCNGHLKYVSVRRNGQTIKLGSLLLRMPKN